VAPGTLAMAATLGIVAAEATAAAVGQHIGKIIAVLMGTIMSLIPAQVAPGVTVLAQAIRAIQALREITVQPARHFLITSPEGLRVVVVVQVATQEPTGRRGFAAITGAIYPVAPLSRADL
jgi:hypothetical protein